MRVERGWLTEGGLVRRSFINVRSGGQFSRDEGEAGKVDYIMESK